jgi:hypothetical protein
LEKKNSGAISSGKNLTLDSRARGYRKDDTFISIIYLLAAPIQHLLKST